MRGDGQGVYNDFYEEDCRDFFDCLMFFVFRQRREMATRVERREGGSGRGEGERSGVECPMCGGEQGVIISTHFGEKGFETAEPKRYLVPCPTCDGEGIISERHDAFLKRLPVVAVVTKVDPYEGFHLEAVRRDSRRFNFLMAQQRWVFERYGSKGREEK